MARGLINFDEGFSSKLITNVVKIKKRATKHSRPVPTMQGLDGDWIPSLSETIKIYFSGCNNYR